MRLHKLFKVKGVAALGNVSHQLSFGTGESEWAKFPALDVGSFDAVCMGSYSPIPYVSGAYTETKDNSGTVAEGSGGLVLTTGAGSNNDTSIVSKRTRLLQLGEWYNAVAEFYVDNATKLGVMMGFGTSTWSELVDPADGVYISKSSSSGVVVGTVRENSNTAVNTGTIATMTNNAAYRFSVHFMVQSSTSATGWWTVRNMSTGAVTKIPFTSSQITALLAMYNTTAPTLSFGFIIRTSEAVAHSATIHAMKACVKL